MTSADLLIEAYDRIHDAVHHAVDGLRPEDLTARVAPGANTIGWLVWHLTRIQDDHVAGVAGHEQVWTSGGWRDRFDLPFDADATGYRMDSDEVAAVRPNSADLLTGYYDAVHDRTTKFLRGLSDSDLDRVVDENFDPPVTMGVRLVSVLNDDLQHAGQAAFVRGLVSA